MDADTSSELDHESSLFLTTLLIPGEAASILGHSHCCLHTHTHTHTHSPTCSCALSGGRLYMVVWGHTDTLGICLYEKVLGPCTNIVSAKYLPLSILYSLLKFYYLPNASFLCLEMSQLNFVDCGWGEPAFSFPFQNRTRVGSSKTD